MSDCIERAKQMMARLGGMMTPLEVQGATMLATIAAAEALERIADSLEKSPARRESFGTP